jgi:hypothetical protein
MQPRKNEEIDFGSPTETDSIGFSKINLNPEESCLTVSPKNRYNLTAKILGG